MSIESFLLSQEPAVRLGIFAGVFAAMALWEVVAPRRALGQAKGMRWINNLVLVALNTVLLRIVFPTTAVALALSVGESGTGLLSHFAVPYFAAVVLSILLLDLVIYLQHLMFHAVPVLWRLHRMHHADLDFDVTTGARFHPIEIVLSMLIKFAAIALLGAPAVAVLVFEVLLNATAMFNHANVRIPPAIDRALRWVVVTPDMHRVHHSIEAPETNSNFGFNLPWWDRLFGTYRAQPAAGHEMMTIGIHGHREPKLVSRLPGMLALPFLSKASGYAINSRRWERQP
jgi:sterol desaturase/sphingolipid hydroxylase (fatty acid hydroxylase superfamily)